MEKESQWSDFYDLLLHDTNTEETEDEWTSIEKTTKGNIKFQSLSTLDELPLDSDAQKSFHHIISQIEKKSSHLSSSSNSNTTITPLAVKASSFTHLENKKYYVPGSFISDEKTLSAKKSITRLLDTQTKVMIITFLIHIIYLWLNLY
ncbi:unnamed protein product [Cunninghamella echinulata]